MRGRRLYASDGRRFLDLRFEYGRGFLGAKGLRAGTFAKNGIERGLTQPAPSIHESRLKKAILPLAPRAAAVSLFSNLERALAALERILGVAMDPGAIFDPVRREHALQASESTVHARAAEIWRPFAQAVGADARPDAGIVLFISPCPAPFGPAGLAFADKGLALREPGDEIPPIMPFVALRALADLDRLAKGIPGGPHRSRPVADASYDETFWKRTDRRLSSAFERRGPYLYARCAQSLWPAFRTAALEAVCVLTPEWDMPSIVPYEFDDGELKNLAAALAGF
ncbi:MAG: hypothetical protein NT080_00430 [Spirochaetes bacterium]|nr:hypothetical protein [Spirochaetota bacterium]